MKTRVSGTVATLLCIAILAALFVWKAQQNYSLHNYVNSNFFSFWLSGHMVWNGQSPYDTSQWMAGFDAAGATYRPSKILQYPLPLMYFMAPIGWLPVGQGYFAWELISQAVIALTVFLLLRRAKAAPALLVAVFAFLLFFGPVYLSLQVGSVGPIFLLAVALALFGLQAGNPLLAGLALSITLLKPPQALTLLLLAGSWFLVRRQWKVLAGMVIGGLALLAIWLIRDPLGLVKFRGSSDFLLSHTLGTQSNVFAFAYLACGRNVTCMWVVGWTAALLILAAGALLLYRNRSRWDDWQAFNLIIPLGFVSAIYLWSYDQLLYIIPVVWIIPRLLRARRAYLSIFAFLLILDIVSFIALGVQAYTQQDLLSILTTALVLAVFLWLQRSTSSSERWTPEPEST